MNGYWRIELLGDLRAGSGEQAPTPLPRLKPTALLAYLAYFTHHPHPREALIELLWPEVEPEAGRLNLRVALHTLRRLLEERGPAAGELLVAHRDTVHLEPAAFTTDIADFRAALQTAAATAALRPRAEALAAVARYTGELLPGFFEPWVLAEREHLASSYLQALQQLTRAREELGDLPGALAAARQAVAVDPLREEAHYDVMRLYAATGQPSACLQQYEELERLLRKELGETPSAEARALAEELQQNARRLVVARPLAGAPPPAAADSVPPPDASAAAPERPAPPETRLPLQLTRFFGREEEIARLTELLASPIARLVTVTGPGGSGKTRLAIAVAGRLQAGPGAGFDGAVTFVPLADLTDAQRLMETIAAALELERAPEVEALEQVVEHLRRQPWLLVLDNFEQLVTGGLSEAEGGAMQVRALLERVPTLTCLVTSRQRLSIGGEQEFLLLPLPTPRRSDLPERLREYASVQLFVDRARAVRPGFELTDAAAAAVAELCDRLEGLPLAIELAAARMRVLTPEQILARLSARFELLESRQRDLPARHRSLRAAIEWSYQLLAPGLQRFFARLSVFGGGWTLEAAEDVCGNPGAGCWVLSAGSRTTEPTPQHSALSTLDLLEQLQESSLVVPEESSHSGTPRYRFLESVREYAWERLVDSGELTGMRDRHRDWYLQLAVGAEPELAGRRAREYLDHLEREYDNLRAALHWSLEAGHVEPAQRLAGALVPFWELRRDLSGGRQALATILALPAAATADGWRARILYGAGLLARTQEDRYAALAYWTEALAIRRQIGDRRGMAAVLASLGDVQDQMMNRAAATALLEESLSLWRELRDRAGQARSLGLLARISTEQEALPAARAMYEEALVLNRELGNLRGQVADLTGLGYLAAERGDLPAARAALEEVLAIQRELGDRWSTASTLFYLGRIAFDQGDHEAARQLWGETLALDQEKMGEGGYVDLCLGWLLAVDGDYEKARRSYEAFVEKERRTASQTDVPDGLTALGDLALQAGDEATAQARYEESLAIFRDRGAESAGERITLLYALWHLARRRSDHAAARSLHEEMLGLHRSLEGRPRVGWLLHYRAMMARHEGDYGAARSLHGQSAALFRELEQRKGLAACLEGRAGLAAAQGHMVRAAQLCGAAAALRERAGQFRIPIDRADYETTVSAARAALGEEMFAAAWSEGRALSLQQAVDDALAEEGRDP